MATFINLTTNSSVYNTPSILTENDSNYFVLTHNDTKNSSIKQTIFSDTEGVVRIPCYVVIFLLGVIGNTLVIVTLGQNRKMRTITNVFLLNLVSILIGLFIFYLSIFIYYCNMLIIKHCNVVEKFFSKR